METHGLDDVQMRFMGHMGEVMKKCQEGLRECSTHTRFEVGDNSKIRF